MHKIARRLRGLFYRGLLKLACGDGISAKKVVFNQTDGNGYGCNQKYIAAEILRRNLGWDLVWLCRDPEKARAEMPEGIRIVPFFSFAAMKELVTAGMWCSNQFFRHHVKHCGLRKRPGQAYFQTWHGSLGIKFTHSGVQWEKLHPESAGNDFKREEAETVDYLIANSDWDAKRQLNHFYGHGEVKLFGHPRNDIFFSDEARAAAAKKVRALYGIQQDERIVLYLPTLRLDKRYDGYLYDYSRLTDALAGRFGGKWRAVARMHPVLLHKGRSLSDVGVGIDASGYPDVQELMAAADALVSDYSSAMFDYMLMRRPCFAYVPDLDSYTENEGLMYPLSETPFGEARDMDALAAAIAAFDENRYGAEVEGFLKGKGCIEDGHAAERTVDLMEEVACRAS